VRVVTGVRVVTRVRVVTGVRSVFVVPVVAGVRVVTARVITVVHRRSVFVVPVVGRVVHASLTLRILPHSIRPGQPLLDAPSSSSTRSSGSSPDGPYVD
jgi:hypothetical protein